MTAHTTHYCAHCYATVYPNWQRVGDGEYEVLCRRCGAQRDREFTAELAIAQALIIIGRLNVREVRG